MPKISVAVAWLRKIEALIKEAEKRGQLPEKVIVEPDDFLNWCKATGREVNRNTRAQFAASLLMRRKHESH